MKNTKKIINNFFKTTLLSLFFISKISPTNHMPITPFPSFPPPPENIEEIMKSEEFQKMVKELEEVFGSIKEEDIKKEKKELEKPKAKKKKPKKKAKKNKIKKDKTKEEKKFTIKDNFLNPAKPEKGKKIVDKLPKEKLQAYDFFMNNLVTKIDTLEKKIDNFYFGIKFKEKVETLKKPLKKISNTIKTAKGTIDSKKLYRKVFFLPIFNEVRKNIINAIEKIEDIENSLKPATEEELTPEEIREKEEIEKLQAMAKKDTKEKKNKKYNKLKKDIKKLFEQNLSKISEELEKITKSTQVTEIIKKKEKKRKREIEEAKRRGEKYIPPHHYPHFESPFNGGGPWWPGPRDNKGVSDRYRRTSSPYSPAIREKGIEGKKVETKPISETADEKEKSRIMAKDKKNTFTIVKNLSQEILDAINEVLKIYKADDENSYQKIANTQLLSKISKNLDLIESKESELHEKQKDRLKKEISSKLNAALDKFIPAGIRLAKYPTNETEQQGALKIIYLKEEKIGTEISKYENILLEKISSEPLTKYDPEKNSLDKLSKNISALLNPPSLAESKEKINKALENILKISEKYKEIREFFVQNTQLPATITTTERAIIPTTLGILRGNMDGRIVTMPPNVNIKNTWKKLFLQEIENAAQIKKTENITVKIKEKIKDAIDKRIRLLKKQISQHKKIESRLE